MQTSESDQEKQTLLNKQRSNSCQCHKRCSTLQFILFSIVITVFAAVIANMDRIIEQIAGPSGTREEIAAKHCSLGVYNGPNISIPYDWHWGYEQGTNGPEQWYKYYGQCACPDFQSPIVIDRELALLRMPKQFCTENNLLNWVLNDNYTRKYNGTYQVSHNNHTINIKSVDQSDKFEPVSAAVLKNSWQSINSSLHSEFVFDHVHFHWGGEFANETGLGHGAYPLEAHFVHYSIDYDSITDAIGDWKRLDHANEDRYTLAVVAVFFMVDESFNGSNSMFDKLLELQVAIDKSKGEMGFVEQVNLMDLLPSDRHSYYYYSGSLTTPPCQPIVRWHVLSQPLSIMQSEWEQFRHLANQVINHNWRPVQHNYNPIFVCHTDFTQTQLSKTMTSL